MLLEVSRMAYNETERGIVASTTDRGYHENIAISSLGMPLSIGRKN